MKIKVTQKHIDQGIPKRCFQCPIALAIANATGIRQGNVAISYKKIFLFRDELNRYVRVEISTTPEITNFMKAFDAGQPVKPFTFEIDTP